MCIVLACALCASADDDVLSRDIPASRFSTPPVIDGDISDTVWHEASVCAYFTDQRTQDMVPKQTRFWLGYDETAIYMAAHCEDSEPQKLIMKQTKRDADLGSDDHITLEIDPYHTHEWNEFSSFSVSARGAQSSRMGGGRGGKMEWKGDWTAAAKIVENGWNVEMAIPWAILAYPDSSEPATIGVNVWRNHPREGVSSLFSNVGETYRNEWAANWVGVRLPARNFSPELLTLPFFAAGGAERGGEYDASARGGVDFRYRPTPELTAVLTVNPDFQNIEGEVADIDFTRGERYIEDRRPFFLEGEDMFRTGSSSGSYFYSRRIERIDAGAKLYGKLARRTNIGAMGTFDFDDRDGNRQDALASLKQGFGDWGSVSALFSRRDSEAVQNSVAGFSSKAQFAPWGDIGFNYGSSAWRGPEDGSDSSDSSAKLFKRGELAGVDLNLWRPRWFFSAEASFLGPGFESSNGFFEYQGRRRAGLYGGWWIERPEELIRGVGMDFWTGYEERYVEGNGFRGFGGLLERGLSQIGERETDAFFRDDIGVWWGMRFRNETFISQHFSTGHFRESPQSELDNDWSHGVRIRMRNVESTRGMRLSHNWGDTDGLRRHYTGAGGYVQRKAVSFNLDLSLLRHRDRLQQHVFGVNVDLTAAAGVGGRVVYRRDDRTRAQSWTPYIAFRRSGAAGIETFFILGDPNGDRFVPRLEGKILFPL